jgi:hypothetical protein
MKNVCFHGCSFTVGEGFPEELRDQYIYDRLVSKYFNYNRTNISLGGSGNYKIFLRSCESILSGEYDIVFTQWSALNRFWLSPGPNASFFLNDEKYPDYRYRDIYLSKKEKEKFKNTFLLLNHDYQNIFDLIDYCKILVNLADKNQVKLIFINGLVPWTPDLVKPFNKDLNLTLSKYSKEILDFDNRDDDEIIFYFKKLQDKFNTLDQKQWVNIFDSFRESSVDDGPEGHHPGIESHKIMADKIIEYIVKEKI